MLYDGYTLGRVIARLRAERHLSQEDLSALSGLARSHLAMIETGSIRAKAETLSRIAAALDLRLSDLIRMMEDECSIQMNL